MIDSNDLVLMEKDNDNLFKVIMGVDSDGKKQLLPLTSDKLEILKTFPGNGTTELSSFLNNYLLKTKTGDDAVIISLPYGELKEKIEKGVKFSMLDFDASYLASKVVDIQKYLPVKPSMRDEPKTINSSTGYNETKIDKAQILQEWGLNIDSLRESGDLKKMLNYGRSSLITCYPIIAGVCFPMQAKFSLREKSDGNLALIPHPIRREPNLREFRGYKFTDEDKVTLLTNGNLGHTININSAYLGTSTEVYLSLDKETNELVVLSKNAIKIPPIIKGVQLTESQKTSLEKGAPVFVAAMKSPSGVSFDATLQVNAEQRKITFSFPADKLSENFKIGEKLLGKDITDDMKEKWNKGEWVYMENLTSKDGRKFSAYVRPNMEKKKWDFAKELSETQSKDVLNRTQKAIKFLQDLESERKTGDEGGPMTIKADAKLAEFKENRKMRL